MIANLGLDAIIAYSLPVLMFLYPLAIVLILLTLFGKLFQDDRTVLQWTIGLTAVSAVFDFLRALPEGTRAALHADGIVGLADRLVAFASLGFGWIFPALLGLGIGLCIRNFRKKEAA